MFLFVTLFIETTQALKQKITYLTCYGYLKYIPALYGASPFKLFTTLVEDLPLIFYRESTNFKWINAGFRLACSELRSVIITCCFRVTSLSGHAALALSPSGIAPELTRIQLSAVCRCGQSGGVIDLLARCCLVFPLRQVALAKLYKNQHQSSNAVSSKLV